MLIVAHSYAQTASIPDSLKIGYINVHTLIHEHTLRLTNTHTHASKHATHAKI